MDHIKVFFKGEKVVVEDFGSEEELGLEEEIGQEQKRNEDILSPNTRKTTDRRRAVGHEFEQIAEVDTLRPPS